MDKKRIYGSSWQKADLHIHTCYSHVNPLKGDMKQLAAEIIMKEIKFVGVTNYFIVEEREIEELKEHLGDYRVCFIPNFEFRIATQNQHGDYINIHVLFNLERITLNDIYLVLGRVKFENQNNEYCTLENVKKYGVGSLTLSQDTLFSQLRLDLVEGEDYVVAGVNSGYGASRPDDKPRNIDMAKTIDENAHLFFGKAKCRDFFLNYKPRQDAGFRPKAVIDGSDCRKLEAVGSATCWIKGELTFEGFKQILFEPEHRISLSDAEPFKSQRIIESVKFNFPSNTAIRRTGTNDNQPLCIRNISTTIGFSPYFTCIVGGRGTGKSTIINLIAQELGHKTDLFENNKNEIVIEDKVHEFGDNTVVKITGTNEVEYISQGKVEELATGQELTKMVMKERVLALDTEYEQAKEIYDDINVVVQDSLMLITEIDEKHAKRKIALKQIEGAKKIIQSITSETYKEIQKKIKEVQKKRGDLSSNIKSYKNLGERLVTAINSIQRINDSSKNNKRVNEIMTHIAKLDEFKEIEGQFVFGSKLFQTDDQNLKKWEEEEIAVKVRLKKYLEERGMSEDSIKDSARAIERIAKLEREVKTLNIEIKQVTERYLENEKEVNVLKDTHQMMESIISEGLTTLNSRLQAKNENLKSIRFDYSIDENLYLTALFKDFRNVFSEDFIINVQDEKVKETLFLLKADEEVLNMKRDEFLDELNSKMVTNSINQDTKYVKIIKTIFKSKANLARYKLLIKRHLYNVDGNIKVTGYYAEKELSSCSFGQRCTAVIVTMLMSGVKPLIIDEPEAHLDNKLIAEYLVGLLKEKKLERQVIFATHNSNFVVGGDSELIHSLEIPEESQYTKISSLTIENVKKRDKLLRLEGGLKAFKHREYRYGFKTKSLA